MRATLALVLLAGCPQPAATVGSSGAVSAPSAPAAPSGMQVTPQPLEVGTHIKRASRGSSTRRSTYETKTVAEVDTTTTFAFATESVVVAMRDRTVDEISCAIREASRVTTNDVLTPSGWVPPSIRYSHEGLLTLSALSGRSFGLRPDGPNTLVQPDDATSKEHHFHIESLCATLLRRTEAELALPAVHLTQGAELPQLLEPIRATITKDLGWTRIWKPTHPPTRPESVTVREVAPNGESATLDYSLGGTLPAATFGAALAVTGAIKFGADGRPITLSASGTAQHRARTMDGIDQATGTVSLLITWD